MKLQQIFIELIVDAKAQEKFKKTLGKTAKDAWQRRKIYP